MQVPPFWHVTVLQGPEGGAAAKSETKRFGSCLEQLSLQVSAVKSTRTTHRKKWTHVPQLTARARSEHNVPQLKARARSEHNVPQLTTRARSEHNVPQLTDQSKKWAHVPQLTTRARSEHTTTADSQGKMWTYVPQLTAKGKMWTNVPQRTAGARTEQTYHSWQPGQELNKRTTAESQSKKWAHVPQLAAAGQLQVLMEVSKWRPAGHVSGTHSLKGQKQALKKQWPWQFSSVQFSSVQDGIYALGKAHNYAFHSVSQTFREGVLVREWALSITLVAPTLLPPPTPIPTTFPEKHPPPPVPPSLPPPPPPPPTHTQKKKNKKITKTHTHMNWSRRNGRRRETGRVSACVRETGRVSACVRETGPVSACVRETGRVVSACVRESGRVYSPPVTLVELCAVAVVRRERAHRTRCRKLRCSQGVA